MWDEIYEIHYPEILRYAVGICQDEQLAQDVAQETFLKALQNADTFENLGPSQRRAWLFRAMKNLIYDRYRRTKMEENYLESLSLNVEYWDSGMAQVENMQLLNRLDPQDRALFHLRYEEGYDATELSAMLGIPAGTIRSRLSRCRKTLKELLE